MRSPIDSRAPCRSPAWAMALACGLVVPVAPDRLGAGELPEVEQARAQLREAGLVELNSLWLVPQEAHLRRTLDRLDALQRRWRDSQDRLTNLLAANRQLQRQYEESRQALARTVQQLRATRSGTPSFRLLKNSADALTAKVKALEGSFVPGEQLGKAGRSRQLALDVASAQTDGAMAILSVRAQVATLDDAYAAAARDPRIAAAFAALGEPARLGPASGYGPQLRQLKSLEGEILGDTLPFYRDGEEIRLSLIVDETAPATFSYSTGYPAVVLPASVAQAAGISVAGAPRGTYQWGDRKLPVHNITLRYLRLGQNVLTSVPAVVLPPEGEDLGAQIGPAALSQFRLVVDNDHLLIRFRP